MLICADELEPGDVIESHDGRTHYVFAVSWISDGKIKAEIDRGANLYSAVFSPDDEIRVEA